jgi:NAD(P)-dependent dehydrogenase (short-subunit alcohol dehydrogenase family)
MKDLKDKVVAITGAGSGIGRATALAFAREGAHLALSDVNAQGLAETAEQARALGVTVTHTEVNVADRAAVYAWADEVQRAHGRVHVIVNNAGVALGAPIETMRFEDFEWLMDINFWGVVYGTKAFLPLLRRAGEGHVVNISSVFGLFAVPTQGAYNASKFAVRGFTECLRIELAAQDSPIGVTCVHPGGIRTNIAAASRVDADGSWGITSAAQAAQEFEKVARTTPERAAQRIVRAVRRNQPRLLIGADAFIFDKLVRLMPLGFQRLMIWLGRLQRRRAVKAAA